MPDASHTEILRYVAGGRELASYLAWDPARDGKRPGVLVLPEWWGLNDYAHRRARELAGLAAVFRGRERGVLQLVSDFNLLHGPEGFDAEFDLVELLANEALDVAVQTANLTVALR